MAKREQQTQTDTGPIPVNPTKTAVRKQESAGPPAIPIGQMSVLEDLVRQLVKGDTPPADRDRMSQEEARRRTELQQLTVQAQTDFQNAQLRLNTEIRTQLAPILADIAKRSGVDVVLNADTIAWAAPGTDTTNEVVQRLNAPKQ